MSDGSKVAAVLINRSLFLLIDLASVECGRALCSRSDGGCHSAILLKSGRISKGKAALGAASGPPSNALLDFEHAARLD